jgi:hypothetical protein
VLATLCGTHKPAEYALSWSSESKVPRVALRADYEIFCKRRPSRERGEVE